MHDYKDIIDEEVLDLLHDVLFETQPKDILMQRYNAIIEILYYYENICNNT